MVYPPLSSSFSLTPSLHAQIDSLNTSFSSLYAKQDFATYTVKGKPAGLYKNAGTFSYLRVFGAGHEVPAYMWRGVPRGAAALRRSCQTSHFQARDVYVEVAEKAFCASACIQPVSETVESVLSKGVSLTESRWPGIPIQV
jgi:hypothetical protein